MKTLSLISRDHSRRIAALIFKPVTIDPVISTCQRIGKTSQLGRVVNLRRGLVVVHASFIELDLRVVGRDTEYRHGTTTMLPIDIRALALRIRVIALTEL